MRIKQPGNEGARGLSHERDAKSQEGRDFRVNKPGLRACLRIPRERRSIILARDKFALLPALPAMDNNMMSIDDLEPMNLPIKLISTDFDGTMFAEFENPPIPEHLQELIGDLQSRGVKWVINTGRDMSGLMEALARVEDFRQAGLPGAGGAGDSLPRGFAVTWGWRIGMLNAIASHEELFVRIRADLPRLVSWVNARFDATVYEDAYSPFCLIAGNNGDAEAINEYLEDYCREVPNLTVVRNDVYARFSHAELQQRHGAGGNRAALGHQRRRTSLRPAII